MIKNSVIAFIVGMILCPLLSAYEPQFVIPDATIDQNFKNAAAELKALKDEVDALKGSTEPVSTANAATATALAANPSDCALPNLALGIGANGAAVCAQPSNVTGNAASVTNGVYTTGSYPNPAWITSLSTAKIDLSTVTTALAGKLDTGGNAVTATALAADPTDCTGVNFARGIAAGGAAACAQPSDVTGNSATATKLATARTINGVSFDGSANINIATTSYLADGVSLALTGATFSANPSSVTLQGNTFNGASQLVKLDALSKLPAVDGSQLLNLPSTSGGAVLATTQTFTGANTFTGSVTASSFTATGSASFTSATSTVTFTGLIDAGFIIVDATCSSCYTAVASCPSGYLATGGGCFFNLITGNAFRYNAWPGNNLESIQCSTVNTDTVKARAICARFKRP